MSGSKDATPPCRRPTGACAGRATMGSVAVEAGLILPLLLLLLLPLFDLGFAAYDSLQVAAAAEAGAQYASTHSWDTTAISDVVTTATGTEGIAASPAPSQFCACVLTNRTLQDSDCSAICDDGSTPGVYARIDARVQHETVLRYPGLADPLVLTGEAIRRIK